MRESEKVEKIFVKKFYDAEQEHAHKERRHHHEEECCKKDEPFVVFGSGDEENIVIRRHRTPRPPRPPKPPKPHRHFRFKQKTKMFTSKADLVEFVNSKGEEGNQIDIFKIEDDLYKVVILEKDVPQKEE